MKEYKIIIKEGVLLYLKESGEYIYRFSFSKKVANIFVEEIIKKFIH